MFDMNNVYTFKFLISTPKSKLIYIICRTPKMSMYNQVRSIVTDSKFVHGILVGILLCKSYEYFAKISHTKKYTNQYIKNDFYQDDSIKRDDNQYVKWDIIGS